MSFWISNILTFTMVTFFFLTFHFFSKKSIFFSMTMNVQKHSTLSNVTNGHLGKFYPISEVLNNLIFFFIKDI